MSAWGKRVRPHVLVLLGGEPTIHPMLSAFLFLARECFPDTTIRLVTNGSFLHQHPGLPETSKATDVEISVTRHIGQPEDLRRFGGVELLVEDWRSKGIKISIPEPYPWMVRYQGQGETMMPFEDGDPAQSWEICSDPVHRCVQLHEGNLWKCPVVAYLPMMKLKYPNLSQAWDLVLAYKSLSPAASDEEVIEFFNRHEEPVCGLCPGRRIRGREHSSLSILPGT
jgi:hypothetical protein